MEELADNNNLTLEQQKELYVATLAHDLKNPLNAQIVAMEQLYNEKFGGLTLLQKEILNDIISSAKFMREMLSSLLSVYKFEHGAVKLNIKPVNIDELIKICLKDVSAFAEYNSVFIEYINNTRNDVFLCDENYIRRVISNMLNNVIIYSYKNTKPLILVEEDSLFLIIKFKNNGYPINENLKSHIFDKYNSGSNKKSGTGLGLYFCKKVIEAHKGIISLNAQNSNIEFCVKLPKIQAGESVIKFS